MARDKTMRKHLSLIKPKAAADKALKNAKNFGALLSERYARTSTAINAAFHWSSTPEGQSFWEKLYNTYESEGN